MDVLTDLLDRARANGSAFALSRLRAPWGIDLAGMPLAIHVVTDAEPGGTAVLTVAGHPPRELAPGDIVLVASGVAHQLRDAAGSPCRSLSELGRFEVPGHGGTFEVPGPGPMTQILCGAYAFSGDVCASLLDALPEVVHLRAGEAESLAPVVGLIASEVRGALAGRRTMLDRLLDVLFVGIVRATFDRGDVLPPPWYRALGDPEVRASLELMHGAPARRWSVAELAAEVGLSRAAFARRFADLVGEPPLTYLTGWRMTIAAQRLRDSRDPIYRIAREVGYSNEFAFSVAFRRAHGVPPSALRRSAVPA